MHKELDLTINGEYDIVVSKQRTLSMNIEAYFMSGTIETPFDFSSYTGATMQVRTKPNAPFMVLEFNTDDGSIVLPLSGNTFEFHKTAEEMAVVRAGEYNYDMYLQSATYPKRAFLTGTFTIVPNITT